MKPFHASRKVLPAAIALAFAHAASADPITINAGGNAANLPVNGATSSANVTATTLTSNSLSMAISGRAVIDWSSFNIAAGNTVNFNGPGGAVLNRVALSDS